MATYGGAPYAGVAYGGSFTAETVTFSIISNTIVDPSSIPVAGVKVVAQLMPTAGFKLSEPNVEIARKRETISNGVGYWELVLENNDNITPDGTYYQITEYIPYTRGGRRVWNMVSA